MKVRIQKTRRIFQFVLLLSLLLVSPAISDDDANDDNSRNVNFNLLNKYVHNYSGGADGGLAHITYWGMPTTNPDSYAALSAEEKAKVGKINSNHLHAAAFQPSNAAISGIEVTGLLKKRNRIQRITFRLPQVWNEKLVVAGTPGLRNEYANEAILVPWLLEAGYAYIAGDKGIPGGANDMISGKHPTRHWGAMMVDLAILGRHLLKQHTGKKPYVTYVMGLSNGGYQTRRALEIDHKSVLKGRKRLFDGGVDWSGTYWPCKRVLDVDGNGKVSVQEYAASPLVGIYDKCAFAMGWVYSSGTQTTAEEYAKTPRFPGAYLSMINAGFSPESALYWGYYNTVFDGFQHFPGLERFKGVGYYNLISYVYRADLRGDDETTSAAYSCYVDPADPDTPPPIYDWVLNAKNGGWNKESVKYALKIANTGVFSAPLLSLHGQHDGLLALNAHGLAYKDSVERYGAPNLHRLYIITHAGHVDKNADGGWGYSSAEADPSVPDLLTPMQAYAQRAFQYLEQWVEYSVVPPNNKFVETDPTNDVVDPANLSW